MLFDTINKIRNAYWSLNEGIESMNCKFGKIITISSYKAAVNILVFLSINYKNREKMLNTYVKKISYLNHSPMDEIDILQTKKNIEENLIANRILYKNGYLIGDVSKCLRYYATIIRKNNAEYIVDDFTNDLAEFFFLEKPKENYEYSYFEDIIEHLYEILSKHKDSLIKEIRQKYYPSLFW